MGISFFKKKAIFKSVSLSFAMKFQRRHWLEDIAWRVERVTQKFRLSRCLFPLCTILCGRGSLSFLRRTRFKLRHTDGATERDAPMQKLNIYPYLILASHTQYIQELVVRA
jgi:hypothetical protein